MKPHIKIADVVIVYEEIEEDKKGVGYEIGKELAYCVKWFLSPFHKQKPLSSKQPISMFKAIDYSSFYSPTVYRKWR